MANRIPLAINKSMHSTGYGDEGLNYDIHKLVDELTEDYDLIRGYWFDSHKPGEKDQKHGF
ncbi:hypothetical protein ACERIT_12180 [Halopenitus sp. H-Gu1]|uniref:hypothetical protein n=1 Tax=Halopenitus sp. H-Gu1 TaxID=3242697 RepID=UPI00359D858E